VELYGSDEAGRFSPLEAERVRRPKAAPAEVAAAPPADAG